MMPPDIMPDRLPTVGRPTKYPFTTMEVGDYFIIPGDAMQPRSAKVYCTTRSRELAKRFRCMETKHGDSYVWRES